MTRSFKYQFMIRFATAAGIVALLIGLAISGPGIFLAAAFGDCKSVQTLQESAVQRGDAHEDTYRKQELAACKSSDGTLEAASATSSPASAEETNAPTETTSPSANPSTDVQPVTPEVIDTERVFYSEASVGDMGKAHANNFGPQVAQDPSMGNMRMVDMNVDQAKQELKYRIARDPMLTAAVGGEFGLWPTDTNTLNAKTKEFVDNTDSWNAAKAAIDEKIDNQSASIDHIAAGEKYRTMYALNGGEVPEIRSNKVRRQTDLATVKFADGVEFKLDCGFQPVRRIDTRKDKPEAMPKPAPGMTMTPEGEPERPSNPPSNPPTTPPSPPETTPPTEPPTTPPSPPETTDKCKTASNPKACKELPDGSGGKPTDNEPSLEPEPTHEGPSAGDPSSNDDNASPAPSNPDRDKPEPEPSAPTKDDPASGDPLGNG